MAAAMFTAMPPLRLTLANGTAMRTTIRLEKGKAQPA